MVLDDLRHRLLAIPDPEPAPGPAIEAAIAETVRYLAYRPPRSSDRRTG
jgi:hypothetical protein